MGSVTYNHPIGNIYICHLYTTYIGNIHLGDKQKTATYWSSHLFFSGKPGRKLHTSHHLRRRSSRFDGTFTWEGEPREENPLDRMTGYIHPPRFWWENLRKIFGDPPKKIGITKLQVLAGGFQRFSLCSPRKLGMMSNLTTVIFFSNGLKPPTRSTTSSPFCHTFEAGDWILWYLYARFSGKVCDRSQKSIVNSTDSCFVLITYKGP